MNIYQPEIAELQRIIEEKYHKALNTTTDFEEFSYFLKKNDFGIVSPSTLKRLWGYVNDEHNPRIQTLDILSRYIEHKDFAHFCSFLKTSTAYNSSFFTAEEVSAKDLKIGDIVIIGWSPNRLIKLLFKGGSSFEVIEAEQSKLLIGDCFEASGFLKGQPLSLPYIIRDGNRTSPFIAGRNGGLTILKCQING
jgi:hypothetical protein